MWRTVVGDGGTDNPYRRLIRLSAEQPDSERPDDLAARKLGLERAQLESWLVSILERWRDVTPAALVEPWDFYYKSGAASRALNARAPRDALTRIAASFYGSLGADPRALRIHYDLVPRSAKGAVSYTTFGARPQRAGGRWLPGEPWIITSYRDGGFGNLVELLHEVGHGVHIAAIRTRPAFADWPDSDTFTEGIGDLAALEAFEPTWQWKYLGDSASTAASLREKYSSIVLDVAWGLFELRMLRAPDTDPNQLWTQLTSQYLHIAPHTDLPWWAMRGQLVDAPGYMVNYALGAILVADLREHVAEQGGRFTTGDRDWYRRVSDGLYRFGLERPTQTVLTEFLGRPLSPDAILRDMARLGAADTGAPAP
jgi:hypothetical protein